MALDNVYDVEGATKQQQGLLLTKIFGYMFIGFLITAGIALGLGYLFVNVWPIETSVNIYYGLMIGSGVVQIIVTLWITFGVFKGSGKSMPFAYAIYCICMGVLISSFVVFVDPAILGGALLITSATFGAMALIGLLTKGNCSTLGMIGFGLLIASAMMGLFLWIFALITPAGTLTTLYIVVSIVGVAAMLLITAYDVHNIKNIIKRGEMTNRLALYCAFQLYVDFIYIFI